MLYKDCHSCFKKLASVFCFEKKIFLVCSLKYYPVSLMDKLLSAMNLISSEWHMQQWVQFPTVVGFVDIQSYVWEKTMRKQNKNKNK